VTVGAGRRSAFGLTPGHSEGIGQDMRFPPSSSPRGLPVALYVEPRAATCGVAATLTADGHQHSQTDEVDLSGSVS